MGEENELLSNVITRDKMSKWTQRATCSVSNASQGTKEWLLERVGCLSASKAASWSSRSRFVTGESELLQEARYYCGLDTKIFSPSQEEAMRVGRDGEGPLREYHERLLNSRALRLQIEQPQGARVRSQPSEALPVKVNQLGLAVWRENPIFRCSVDGEIDEDTIVEYKIPSRMSHSLVSRVEQAKRGIKTLPGDYSHIYNDHYDQMMMNCAILNKRQCWYVVYSQGELYEELIPFNETHWRNILVPAGLKFYEKYMTPLINEFDIEIVLPD
jgi:hypothetical protein